MRPAIVLSDFTMGLGVARALGTRGVPVVLLHYGEGGYAHASRYVSESAPVPHPGEAEGKFLDLLLDCARRHAGAVLIPASDESLAAVSRNKAALERHYRVACPEWEITRLFLEKKFTYTLAREAGVPAPRTLYPRSLKEALGQGDRLGFPCLVKPSQSHLFYQAFLTKMFRVESAGQLEEKWRQATAAGVEVMLQEIIPGEDSRVVNYNAYAWGGESLVEFTAVHLRNAPPGFGAPRVVFSQEIPEVVEPGRRILKALGFYGYACTEFKRDARDGIYKLMEVNGRHNLSTLLAVRCGINFPWLEYRHHAEGELPSAVDYRQGIYWIDLIRDVGYSVMNLKTERYSPKQYLLPYLRPHVFAILDPKDLKPFARRLIFVTGKTFKNAYENIWNKRKKDGAAEKGIGRGARQQPLSKY